MKLLPPTRTEIPTPGTRVRSRSSVAKTSITSQLSSATPRWPPPARFEACQRPTLATTRHNPDDRRCRRPNFVVAPALRRVDRCRLRFPDSSDTHAAPPDCRSAARQERRDRALCAGARSVSGDEPLFEPALDWLLISQSQSDAIVLRPAFATAAAVRGRFARVSVSGGWPSPPTTQLRCATGECSGSEVVRARTRE